MKQAHLSEEGIEVKLENLFFIKLFTIVILPFTQHYLISSLV
jgi:hypothetical protein